MFTPAAFRELRRFRSLGLDFNADDMPTAPAGRHILWLLPVCIEIQAAIDERNADGDCFRNSYQRSET